MNTIRRMNALKGIIPGKHLAMAKMKLMIYTMLRTFDMSALPGEGKMELDRKYTIVKVTNNPQLAFDFLNEN